MYKIRTNEIVDEKGNKFTVYGFDVHHRKIQTSLNLIPIFSLMKSTRKSLLKS